MRSLLDSCWERYALGIGLAAILAVASPATALPLEARVGSGPDLASVVLEFGDGAEFLFEIEFDEAVPTSGLDIMEVLAVELAPFEIVVLDFGFGDFIDAISYDGHSNGGFGGGELFWHYWVRESELDPWGFSAVGSAARLMTDGAWDGWVYGSTGVPLPEPATGLLLGLGLLACVRARGPAQSSSA